MFDNFDQNDWNKISAGTAVISALITLLAILAALFGERAIKWFMRPKLSLGCGLSGHLFQEDKDNFAEQDCFHVRFLVVNSGKESVRNVQCLVTGIRKWDGENWHNEDQFLPQKMNWTIEEDETLIFMAPGTSSLLSLGRFFGKTQYRESCFDLFHTTDFRLFPGRYEVELVLTSEHSFHYRGSFEFSWNVTDGAKTSDSFAIRESSRIKWE